MPKWWMLALFALMHPSDVLADQTGTLQNPFLTAGEYLSLAGARPAAELELKFREVGRVRDAQTIDRQIVLDLATNWAQLTVGDEVTLVDFGLERTFSIDRSAKAFVTANLAAIPLGRMETRFSRDAERAAGDLMGIPHVGSCDVETELTVAISLVQHDDVAIQKDGNASLTALCGGKTIGAVTLDGNRNAPAILWPVIAELFPFHPKLLAEAAARGQLPMRLEAAFGFRKSDPATRFSKLWAQPRRPPRLPIPFCLLHSPMFFNGLANREKRGPLR